MKSVRVLPAADADLDREAAYLFPRSPAASVRFYSAAEATFEFLSQSPEIGTLLGLKSLTEVRVWRIRGFPNHLVFYRDTSELLEVVRVLHGAQDWTKILEGEL